MKSTTSLNKLQTRVEDKELTKGFLAEELEKVSMPKLVDIAKDATTFYGEGGEGIIELQKEPVNNTEDVKKVMKKYISSLDDEERESILQSFNSNNNSYKTDLYQFNLISDKNGNMFLKVQEINQNGINQSTKNLLLGEKENWADMVAEDTDPEWLIFFSENLEANDVKLIFALINNSTTPAEALDNVLLKAKQEKQILKALGHQNISKEATERVAKTQTEKKILEYLVEYDINRGDKKSWCEDIRYNLTQNQSVNDNLLQELAKKGKEKVQSGVLGNKNKSDDTVKMIAQMTTYTNIINKIYKNKDYIFYKEDKKLEVWRAISANSSTPSWILDKIMNQIGSKGEKSDIEINIMENIASNPNTEEDRLTNVYKLYKNYSDKGIARKMCNALATNPSTPPRILSDFAKNNKYWISKLDLPKGLAANQGITEDVALILAKKENQDILKILTENKGEGITQQVLGAIVNNKNVGEQTETKKEAQARLKALQAQEAAQKQALQTQEAQQETPNKTSTDLDKSQNTKNQSKDQSKELLDAYTTSSTTQEPVTIEKKSDTNKKGEEKEKSDFIITKENIKERGGTIRAIQIGRNGYWKDLDTKYRKDKGIDARQTGENAYAGIFFEKKAAEDYIAKNEKKRGGMKTITTISPKIAEDHYNFDGQENITSYDRKSQETAPSATSEVKNGGEKPLENPTVEDVKNSKDINILTVYSKSQDPKIRKAVIENNESTPLLEDFCKKETDSEVIEALIKVINQLGVYGRDKPYKGKGILQKRGLRKEQ